MGLFDHVELKRARNIVLAALTVLLLFASTILSTQSWAQDATPTETITRPNFTQDSLDNRMQTIEANEALSAEQKEQAKSFLEAASARLNDGQQLTNLQTQFQQELQSGPETIDRLSEEIAQAREQLASEPEPLGEMIGEAALFRLEQQLIQKESRLRALQAEAEGYTSALQSITSRQTTAPVELNEARSKLTEVNTALADLGETDLDGVNAARRTSLISRRYYRQSQIAALEAEITSLPQRQEVTNLRRTLTNLRAEILSREVRALQEQTGQRRVNEAAQIVGQAETTLAEVEGMHPAVVSMAKFNLELAQQIKNIAQSETTISRDTASVRGRQAYVSDDLTAATQLVELGNLDREAGGTLRRLQNQIQSPREIRANLDETGQALAQATRQRIVAQESLRDLPLGRIDRQALRSSGLLDGFREKPLSDADIEMMQLLIEKRRNLLRQLSQNATARINHLTELSDAQENLLEKTEQLQSLLSENLLWVPSVPAVDLAWFPKIFLGAVELFSPRNISVVAQVGVEQLQALWPIFLVIGLLIYGLWRMRPSIWENVVARADKVGRVTVDNMWHTPNVVLSGILIALPLPILFLSIGVLYATSDNPAPIIEGMRNAFLSLTIFALIILTWRSWDRDKSLFAAHFKMPKPIRQAIMNNLRWFLPLIGVGIVISELSDSLPSPNATEGLSLFTFIAIALTLAVFGFRVLWAKRHQWAEFLSRESFLIRHRGMISVFIIGAPLVVAILAALGYSESAEALLSRVFLSGVVFLLGYVVYGTVKRAITVAQRQIKYRQAIEKRDAALKARQEKAAAEERGEEMAPPAPIDTKEIDVTSITRQSHQLLTVIVVGGLLGLLWMIWADLLPALSFFDSFQVWEYNTGAMGEDGLPVIQPVTLWNILQTLVILLLTFFAARNLPGFLEVFVLNRMGVDAGTRYAVVTILGYIIVAFGVIIGFDRLGLQWSQLKFVAAGLSVGIGFGLQKIIANFVSGLIILFERPVRIGDYVTIGDQSGTVSRIQIRATTLADLDNREILIPNEALISERVTNWTLTNSVTRLTVPVGIAYGSDTDKAREIMLETLKGLPKVLDNPPPQVLFFGFGASSLDFELRVFLRSFDDRVPMRHQIHTEINKALAKAGFTIPFPQTDLNIVSQNIPLQIAQSPKPRAKRKPSPPKDKKA